MRKVLILKLLLLISCVAEVKGQVLVSPTISIEATDTVLTDIKNGRQQYIPSSQIRTTNYNPSVYISDSTPYFVYDSLRTSGAATIVTVYETDEDSVVGLWQIGSGENRALWLNSQCVSYEDFSISYRTSTEQGVVIHTMLYQYPEADSNYNGYDTLFLGREGSVIGDKNLCAWIYIPGRVSHTYQRWLESTLAVRYGALLHGPYIDRHSDTLWNPLGTDSLYSFGVCGIGRDDSLSLFQPKSVIRNDMLTIEAIDSLADLDYVMLGCDSNPLDFTDDIVVIDTILYHAISRKWQLRSHTSNDAVHVRLSTDLPLQTGVFRLMLTTDDSTSILTPDTSNTFTITLAKGQDYRVTLLIDDDAMSAYSKGAKGQQDNGNGEEYPGGKVQPIVSISPNPTAGRYTATVTQPTEDFINIRVADAVGRIVDQYTTTERQSQYQHNGYLNTDGIYYVTVTSNGQQKTIKLIVVK